MTVAPPLHGWEPRKSSRYRRVGPLPDSGWEPWLMLAVALAFMFAIL